MKRFALALLAIVMVAGFGFSPAHSATEIKITSSSPENFPFAVAFGEMAKFIQEKSNGKYKVSLYMNYKLGNTGTCVQGLQMGTIHFHHDSTGNMSAFSPLLGLFDLPYIFPDLESVDPILYGPIGQKMLGQVTSKTLTYLGFAHSTFRHMMIRKPAATLDELRKTRVRVTLSKIHAKSLETMGIQVTPMPATEVYTAIQQGVIDGLDIDYPFGVANRWYEVAPYMVETGHLYSPQVLVTGTRWWNSLPAEDKKIFEEATQLWLDRCQKLLIEHLDTAKKVCVDAGTKIITPSKEEMQKLVEAAQPTRALLSPEQKQYADEIRKELIAQGKLKQ